MTEPPATVLASPVNRAATWWPSSISLAVRPESVALARRFVRDVVSGHTADPYAVALVTSELVTNALRAAVRVGSPDATIGLSLAVTDRWTHLCVADPSPVPPTPRECGIDEETGRGLAIVTVYAACPFWVTSSGAGKTVHAVLAAPGVTLDPAELNALRANRHT